MYDLWDNVSFEQMLQKTVYSDRTRDIISDRWYSLDDSEEFDALEKLSIQDKIMTNLADPIASGMNYGMRDVQRKLKDIERDERS